MSFWWAVSVGVFMIATNSGRSTLWDSTIEQMPDRYELVREPERTGSVDRAKRMRNMGIVDSAPSELEFVLSRGRASA